MTKYKTLETIHMTPDEKRIGYTHIKVHVSQHRDFAVILRLIKVMLTGGQQGT